MQIFAQGPFRDFGSSLCLAPECQTSVTRVDGQRAGELRKQVRLLCPRRPGVYGMLDAHDQLLYVGKAKDLRTRLLSYFRRGSRPPKAGKIIAQTSSLLWEAGPHEFVSLLRELELIRRWRPRWNVQGQPLRRRQTFLCLGRSPAYFFAAHKPPARVLAAVGPVPAGLRLREAIRRLNDLYRLRDCPERHDMIFPEQGLLFAEDRPAGCLRLEIGTCLGPCAGVCTRREYHRAVQQARAFLAGRDLSPLQALEGEMHAASAAHQFERAAALRDRWQPLDWLAGTLERLRFAQNQMSFVYPVSDHQGCHWWYLIHGARAVAALAAPRTEACRRQARELLREVYRLKKVDLLEPYEHVDGMAVVMSWFRKYPEERLRTLTPDEALEVCGG